MAQGQPSEASLQSVQRLLEDEERQPALLNALRGERAYQDIGMLKLETGGLSGPNPLRLLAAGWMERSRVAALEMNTEMVDIAKLPVESQWTRFEAMSRRVQAIRSSVPSEDQVLASLAIQAELKVVEGYLRSQAELRCAIAALAAERYRQAHGRWPESLDQLAPEYLPAVAKDPFNGGPLRYRRLDDGIAIYSIGADGIDNGGNDDRKNHGKPGTDLVFRLWNVERRRQPAAKK